MNQQINRRLFLGAVTLTGLALSGPALPAARAAGEKPNIIFIMADDK